ncbi:hypothetical protein CCR94_07335 [Rhodoblastus sphagnicola]|uniref:DUF1178 domain-containing protein n=1 Tax=Rhodoblastus sphagnicola TaxID=333368 RepID=A0A2S6NBL2_9HYPH|nr:DUF1178 family protein [Rhodoblastus sphagnicola]MBB4199669.1 hypothetical protein [Rhodoblastus sphagnicola]PPQ32010.1 hypothetical protein CCR94_07335 [Rhodoblastus sphagnicola]
MIRFTLVCDNGHEFDSWFASNESYEFQIDADLVACPHCNSVKVSKGVMAPAVARTDRGQKHVEPIKQSVALVSDSGGELRRLARELHEKIVASTVDVGEKFPDEARRIHGGEAPDRAIRGQASLEEARALIEDGVAIMPVPILPEKLG